MTTGKKPASIASKELSSKTTSASEKKVAGSALSQAKGGAGGIQEEVSTPTKEAAPTRTISAGGVTVRVSPADAALLGTVFQIADPSRLRGLRTDIPDAFVVEIDRVEGVYEVLAGRAERRRWIRCCECGTDRNQKRGFVLRFADGTRATVGRDCARDEHSLDFDAYLEAFQGKRDRARRLRQLAAVVAIAPETARHLRMVRDDPAVLAALRVRRDLETRLPDVFRRLAASPDGVILAPAMVRDLIQERLRDERLDRKLDAVARRQGRDRGARGVDQSLLDGLRAAGDADASKEPIMSKGTVEVGRYSGAGFLTVLQPARSAAARIEDDLLRAVGTLNGKETSAMSDVQLDGARRAVAKVLDAALVLCGDVERALAFAEPGNLGAVVRASNKFKGAAGKLTVVGSRIVRETPVRVEVNFTLPRTAVPRDGLERAGRRLDEAGTNEEAEPELTDLA